MAATEMNFGPDWLRALQDGMPKSSSSNSSSSMSNSSISTTSKLMKSASVKYRYSCEEMLLYYNRDNCFPPKDLLENEEVFIDRVQEPLLFSEPTMEEINLLSQSINSDYIVKKAAKENGDGTNERASDYRDRTEDRESRIKLMSASGEMIMRKPPGITGIGNSGMFAERGNGHPLRPGRGGNLSERGSRTGIRGTAGSLFARVSSYDETTTRSNTITSATLLTAKKGGLQRASTDNNSTNTSATSLPNTFVPAWRTTTTVPNQSSNTSTTSGSTTSTTEQPKSEWRSNSEASKNWRSDNSANSSTTPNKTAANNTATSQKTPTKDFFETSESDSTNAWDVHAREYLNRKRGVNPVTKPTTKPFNRRFDSENNDLFKPKPFDSFESFESEDRDLFGGGRLPGSSFSGGFEGLGGNRGKPQNASGARFSRDRSEYGQNNEKWNHGTKAYGQNNDRENRYAYRYPNQHYQRSNSQANENDGDRFGGGGALASDDDEYRRNSLPEWSLDDTCTMDVTRVGTFDASGAFQEAIEDADIDAKGSDKTRDNRKKEKQTLSKAKSDEQPKTKPIMASDASDERPSVKKEISRFSSEESSRSSQQSNSSALRLDQPKIDYFNMSDPSMSPNHSKNKENSSTTLAKDDDNDSFAQLEKDTRKLLSKFDLDDEGDSSLLSNQISKLFKEESQGEDPRLLNQHQLQSQSDAMSFLHERFQQPQSTLSQQKSLFSSSSLLSQLNAVGTNPTKHTSDDLLNQHLVSSGSSSTHKNSLSMLNEDYAFSNFRAPISSSNSVPSNSNTQSLFSGLSRQTSKHSPFDSSLGLGQLETNEDINLGLSIMQSQQKHDLHEQPNEIANTKLGLNMKQDAELMQWFYRDPQGTVQGPFSATEMYDWFVNGYFSMELLVRRSCDPNFTKLGDLYNSVGRVPFLPPVQSPFMPADTGDSFIFGPSSLLSSSSNLNHSQPTSIAPSIVPPSPSYLHEKPSPQQQPSIKQSHLPFGMLDDLNKPAGNSMNINSGFFSQPSTGSIKEDKPVAATNILNMFQRQQSQTELPTPHIAPDSQIANLLGIGPQNTLQAQTQLRLILSHLMKNERFQQLTNAQQNQIVMEKFIQMNSQNLISPNSNSNNNNNQQYSQQPVLPVPHSDFTNQQQQVLPQPRPTEPSSIETTMQKPPHEEVNLQSQPKLLPEGRKPHVPSHESFDPSPAPHNLHNQSHPAQLEQSHQVSQPNPQQAKPNPLQLLQAAIAAGTNSTTQWENIVPGAMSLSAVEELQRREAEERYKMKQEKEEEGEFEHKVDRKRQPNQQVKAKQQELPKQPQLQTVKQQELKPPAPQTQKSGKVQVIDSKPVIEETEKMEHIQIMQQASNVPQVPKKSAWGTSTIINDADTPSTLSIAEIQKLQEKKELEEEEKRKRALEQQMASFIANQQQAQAAARAGHPPLKWASQSWQEQNNSKIKTLTEIQAEEAEKAALLRAQQEAEAKRLQIVATNSSVTPLSAIVSKGVGGAWNNSNSQIFISNATNQKNSLWDEDENPTPAASAAMPNSSGSIPNYKSAINKSTKVESAFIKQILKTNPRNIKKLEEAQLAKISVDSIDELCRYSVDILNKAFDSIDANGFMAIIKELSTPNEVIEYMQSYLGNNQSAMYFAKFYISKKSYLFNRSKQENAERAKLQQLLDQAKSINQRQQVGSWDDDDDEGSHRGQSSGGSSYKSALNQSIAGQSQKKSNTSQSKTKNQQSQSKAKTTATPLTEMDMNIMNAPVESMEEFDNWCMEVLRLNPELNIDPETFISFLKYLDSPFEINEYVQTYLGTSKLARDFAKNFISKRSYLRNKNKNEQIEDMCGPAPALNPSANKSEAANDNNGFVTVGNSNKKKRKGKSNTTQPQPQQQQQQTVTIHTTTLGLD